MKQWTKRIVAIVLALAMTGGVLSASAAGEEENRVVDPAAADGYTLTLLDKNGTEVTHVNEEVGGVAKDVWKNVAKISVSFTGTAGKQYVVFLLSGDTAVPTKSNICYIDQKAGAASMEFVVYPTQLTEPGTYTVLIASEDGLVKAGSLKVAEPDFIIGDTNKDGLVAAADAGHLLQYLVELLDEDDVIDLRAADTNKDGLVAAADAGVILQVLIGILPGF